MAVFVLLVLMFLSFGFNKITDLLSLLGATSQIYLIFIVPILIYVKSFTLTNIKKIFYYIILTILSSIGLIYLILLFLSNFVDVFTTIKI